MSLIAIYYIVNLFYFSIEYLDYLFREIKLWSFFENFPTKGRFNKIMTVTNNKIGFFTLYFNLLT